MLFHGRPCWEKPSANLDERRVIFFSNPLLQWKISDRFDDQADVYAFANARELDDKSAPTGANLKWCVFDGKEHKLDPEVRFVELEDEEEPEKKRKKAAEPVKEEGTPLDLASRHLAQCTEMHDLAQELKREGTLETAAIIYGRGVTKKNYQINGIYSLRTGKYHGAVCYQKETNDPKAGKKFLLYSATKQQWKITDKIQDQDSFAYARVEDRGKQPPPDLPKGYLTWKVFSGKQGGYKKDDQVFCTRVDIPTLAAALQKAKAEVKALRVKEAENNERLARQACDDRVQAAVAAVQRETAPGAPGQAAEEEGRTRQEDDPTGGRHEQLTSPKGKDAFACISSEEEGEVDIVEGPTKVRRRTSPSSKASQRPARDAPPAVKIVVSCLEEDAPAKKGVKEANPKALPKRKVKACAKMLVRAGLRCSCCFRLRSECQASK